MSGTNFIEYAVTLIILINYASQRLKDQDNILFGGIETNDCHL